MLCANKMNPLDVGLVSDLLCGSPPDYVFVTPIEVDAQGGYVSHDMLRRGRNKRSLPSMGGPVHYRLSAFGWDMHLDLQPSMVVAEGFTVQVLGTEGITTLAQEPAHQDCLYQGFIRNLTASSAAISTCSGLVSVPLSL